MGLSDLFASRLARPAGRVLDAPIRDIVQQVLKESGYASPAEVQALRDEARDLGRRLDAIDRRAGDLARMLEEARAAAAGARADASAAHAEATSLRSELAAVRADAGAAEARSAALATSLESARADIEAARTDAAAARAGADVARAAAARAEADALGPRVAPAPLVAAPRGNCKVSGCEETVRSKGFCSAHYQQWRRGTLRGYESAGA